MADTRWIAERTEPGVVHVRPLGDLMEHEESPDCWCGPRAELVRSDDGPDGWLHVHAALDGRELRERAKAVS